MVAWNFYTLEKYKSVDNDSEFLDKRQDEIIQGLKSDAAGKDARVVGILPLKM